jgi:hypothetical protein
VTTNRDDEDDASSVGRLRWLLGGLCVLVVGLTVVWWPGCRSYPVVTSAESLNELKRLYGACNTRDVRRLQQCEDTITRLDGAGKLSADEVTAFRKIIGMARANQWDDAQAAALKFAEDQIGRGHPAPEHAEPHAKPVKGKR